MANEQNLIPAVKGEVRNPNGRPKGAKSWSTVVREVLNDEELFNTILATADKVPAWVQNLNKKNAANAIAVAMAHRALAGDKQAAEWLRKTGYGDKIDITSDGQPLKIAMVQFVGPGNADDTDTD